MKVALHLDMGKNLLIDYSGNLEELKKEVIGKRKYIIKETGKITTVDDAFEYDPLADEKSWRKSIARSIENNFLIWKEYK